MKSNFARFFIVFVVVSSSTIPTLSSPAAECGNCPSVVHELIVGFKPGLVKTVGQAAMLVSELSLPNGLEIGGTSTVAIATPSGGTQLLVRVSGTTNAARAASELARDPRVEYAVPNNPISVNPVWPTKDKVPAIADGPNDPLYADQWALDQLRLTKRWDEGDFNGTDASAIKVVVIDTGIDLQHEDLRENLWVNPGETGVDMNGISRSANGVDDDNNGVVDDLHGANFATGFGEPPSGNPDDDHYHGTHVAGIIGARGNNGVGVTGIVWRTQLIASKFIGRCGIGFEWDAIRAVDYAIKVHQLYGGPMILNCSWGGPGSSPALESIFRLAEQEGILIIAAAGNNGNSEVLFPAAGKYRNIVSVAAIRPDGTLAEFSNFGEVDVAAPGKNIISTVPEGDQYIELSGTSMATPCVVGVAATIWGQYPNASCVQVKRTLLDSATMSPALQGKVGYGVINAYQASKNAARTFGR